MSWWQAVIGTGGAGGVLAFLGRILKSRRVRSAIEGAVGGGTTVDELVVVLEEQRKGYDHLAARVDRLESEIARLETNLDEARIRERALEVALAEERRVSGQRIAALEVELAQARARIAYLEAQLTSRSPDAPTPGVEA